MGHKRQKTRTRGEAVPNELLKPQAKGWTPERRAKQAEAIRRWKPWEQSTGATTPEGKRISSQNAFKGGVRPRERYVRRLIWQRRREIDKRLKVCTDVFERYELIDEFFEWADELADTWF